MQLSKNFSLSEFTKSSTAIRLGIDNTPNEEQIENLKQLTTKVLQPARDELGPMIITSGFRSAQLNSAVNGSPRSQHVTGNAADVESLAGVSTYDLACWIMDNCEFDQLILEYYTPGDPNSGWVHVSYVTDRPNRNEVLTIGKGITKRGLHY